MLTPAPARPASGFTLVELLIAMALGLSIVAGVAFMLFETAKTARQALHEAQLRQAMATAISVIDGELRRAGYWSGAGDTADAPLRNGHAVFQLVGNDCLLFGYDRDAIDGDGVPADSDRYGLRLSGAALQIRTSGPACATPCAGCTGGNWFAVTDPQAVAIDTLAFRETVREIGFGDDDRRLSTREIGVTLAGRLRAAPGSGHRAHAVIAVRNDGIR